MDDPETLKCCSASLMNDEGLMVVLKVLEVPFDARLAFSSGADIFRKSC